MKPLDQRNVGGELLVTRRDYLSCFTGNESFRLYRGNSLYERTSPANWGNELAFSMLYRVLSYENQEGKVRTCLTARQEVGENARTRHSGHFKKHDCVHEVKHHVLSMSDFGKRSAVLGHQFPRALKAASVPAVSPVDKRKKPSWLAGLEFLSAVLSQVPTRTRPLVEGILVWALVTAVSDPCAWPIESAYLREGSRSRTEGLLTRF
ncbi:UDP-2,3-diacylglucosamine hydrolase [Striga asiatica]|uniref:UDP-2,3-diacylglucosamine hydrolase n=1 Tax=Striga asiatica TaxID=4170 RepID=A0A5A7Q2F6_STRAF|nr:UDP-2,3-diacylglucosamine hydrolase [Striga asiatica]